MDPISTALTAAWLDAFRRVQSDTYRRLVAQAPQTVPSRAERTLTDVIESALVGGGARRVANTTDASAPGRMLDVMA